MKWSLHSIADRIQNRLFLLNYIIVVKCQRSWNYLGDHTCSKKWECRPRPPRDWCLCF